MYFYGHGVIRDLDKAKSYLESLAHSVGAEVIYALGDIYMKQTGNFGQAVELFQNFLIQPYKTVRIRFIRKYRNGLHKSEVLLGFGLDNYDSQYWAKQSAMRIFC